MKNSQCSNGILDPTSDYGRATVTEYVVLNVLGNCQKQKANAPFDLKSKKYGTINVKSSKICTYNNVEFWSFNKKNNSFIPDYYVCIGLSKYYHVIKHVWFIPGDADIVTPDSITINKNEYGLNKAKCYEVNCDPYNNEFRSFNNSLYPEFCNIEPREFKKKLLDYVKPNPDKINYEEYLRYIQEYEFKNLAFDPEDGKISLFHNIWVIPLTEDTYPVFNYNGEYIGFMENGVLIKVTYSNKIKISMYLRILKMVKSLTKYNGRADFRYISDKYGIGGIEDYLKEMCKKKAIKQINNYEYVYIKEGESL